MGYTTMTNTADTGDFFSAANFNHHVRDDSVTAEPYHVLKAGDSWKVIELSGTEVKRWHDTFDFGADVLLGGTSTDSQQKLRLVFER